MSVGNKMLKNLIFIILALSSCYSFSTDSNDELFDGERSLEHIRAQVEFGPRTISNPRAREHTLKYIEDNLSRLTTKITRQPFSAYGLEGINIWATFVGHRDRTNKSRLMLGAHWDTRPISEKDSDPSKQDIPTSGANDGASGVAMLLELARIFSLNPPPVTIDLVFFDLEDMGNIDGLPFAIGAREFVKRNQFYRPSGGIILDMVCDKDLVIPRELYSKKNAVDLMDHIWSIAKKQNAQSFLDKDGTFITDDHLPFLEVGIPVVDLIHYPFPYYWHTSEDTVDKCSSNSLKQVGDVIYALVYG